MSAMFMCIWFYKTFLDQPNIFIDPYNNEVVRYDYAFFKKIQGNKCKQII
jgi:hypothetical protein